MDGNTEETPKHPESENATQDQSTQTEASKCNICEKYSDVIKKLQEYEEHTAIAYQMIDQHPLPVPSPLDTDDSTTDEEDGVSSVN